MPADLIHALLYDPAGSGDTPDVVWEPLSPPQEAFVNATEFEVLYGGAKGGAKTDSLIAWAVAPVSHAGYKGLLLRSTYGDLREIKDRCDQLYPPMGGVWHAEERRYMWENGASVELGYCERIEDVNRYQGREFARIGFDEIGQLADERTWERLIAECRSPHPDVPRGVACTANPGGVGHAWLRRRFIDPCGLDGKTLYSDPRTGLSRRFIPARVRDNPIYAEDKQYLSQLAGLPDVMRQQLLDGDWSVGQMLALGELAEGTHMRPFHKPPDHWFMFGALDWGFAHRFAFGAFGVDEFGTTWLMESVHAWRLLPDEQIARVKDALAARQIPIERIRYTVAGHDVKNVVRARGETTPSLAEQYARMGLPVSPIHPSRIQSLDNFRRYVQVRSANGKQTEPRFKIMDTPANRITFEILRSMVTDPDNPEDALKVDTDPMTGEGGDDAFDMCRYGLASRPLVAKPPVAPHAQERAPKSLQEIVGQVTPEPSRAPRPRQPVRQPQERMTYRPPLVSR